GIMAIPLISVLMLGLGPTNVFSFSQNDSIMAIESKLKNNNSVLVTVREKLSNELEDSQELEKVVKKEKTKAERIFQKKSRESLTDLKPFMSEKTSMRSKLAKSKLNVFKEAKLNPYSIVELKEPKDLKTLLTLGFAEIEETIINKPQLDVSTTQVGAQNSWLRDVTNTSSPDNGINGTGKNKIIGILDTGVLNSHPFLKDKVVLEACFSTNSRSSTSLCPNGSNEQYGPNASAPCSGMRGCDHGTHVAGIAAGKRVDETQPTTFNGVAPDAKLIGVNVFSQFSGSSCGSSSPCILSYDIDQIDGLNYIILADNSLTQSNSIDKIASVNMSIGGGLYTSSCNRDAKKSYIDTLKNRRIATVIAAGNSGQNSVSSPGCISSAITVGSTTKDTAPTASSFSNYRTSMIDVWAPGNSINSSILNNAYASYNGTSMATPHVAGALAVLHGVFPTHSVDTNVKVLRDVGTPFTFLRGSTTFSAVRMGLCRDYVLIGTKWNCVVL
ncbi:MAG: S8 family peptidase, partial [Patescibacteria group bacterium]